MEDVVLLAGGTGTRLRPRTTVRSKPLMPVGDMPVLDILLRRPAAWLVRANLAFGHLAELIEAYSGDGAGSGSSSSTGVGRAARCRRSHIWISPATGCSS
jgi:NDP-sugar pyrophosphorylase family protein